VTSVVRSSSPIETSRDRAAIEPIYQQIRDIVYNVSGNYDAEEELYLLTDGCGRRMKILNLRQPRE